MHGFHVNVSYHSCGNFTACISFINYPYYGLAFILNAYFTCFPNILGLGGSFSLLYQVKKLRYLEVR